MENEPRPVYTEQQKLRAIRLYFGIEPGQLSNLSVSQIAKEIGCSKVTIHRWIKEYIRQPDNEVNPYNLDLNGAFSERWMGLFERRTEWEKNVGPSGQRLNPCRMQKANDDDYLFEAFDGCLYVQADPPRGESVKLMSGALARVQFIGSVLAGFQEAQGPPDFAWDGSYKALPNERYELQVASKLGEDIHLVLLGQVVDYPYISIHQDPLSPWNVRVIEFSDLNRLEYAITQGLPLPCWVLRTSEKKYQVGWTGHADKGRDLVFFNRYEAHKDTRKIREQHKMFAKTPANALEQRLRGAEIPVFLNPTHHEADLLLAVSRDGTFLTPSTLMKAAEDSYAPAIGNPHGTHPAGPQSSAYKLAVQNGRSGGRSRSEKKVSSARLTVSQAREARQVQASSRRNLALKMFDDGVPRGEIQQALGVSYRQVQRYLSAADIM